MSKMICLVWLMLLLASCGCSGERIIFQDVLKSDCAAPCWRGVIPGSTVREEMLELVSQPPDTDTAIPMAWGDSLKWGERCVDHRYSPPQVKINLDSKDIVESIVLVDPDQQYTFQHAFDEFGSPTVVLMTPCSPDSDLGFVYLVYPEKGLGLGSSYMPTLGRPWQQPSAETRVYQWVYFDPIAAKLFPPKGEPIYGCGMPYANVTSTWQGFGSD
jgi:hypothetical protein